LVKEDATQVYSKISDERTNLVFDISFDALFDALNDAEKEEVNYVLSGHKFRDFYNEEPLSSFRVLNGSGVIKDKYTTILAKLYFVDGAIAIVPFNVAKVEDGFRIVFTLDDIEVDGYKIIRESAYKEPAAPAVTDISQKGLVQPQYSGFNWKDDYTFDYLYSTIYGIDTFSMTKWVGNFDGYQYNYLYPSWQLNASVIYAICIPHWYGDNVWGSTGNPVVRNGSFDVYFQGKNNSFNNCKIRITNTTGSSPRSRGGGSVYQCNN